MKWIVSLLLLSFASVAVGQQAPRPPQAPPMPFVSEDAKSEPKVDHYAEAYAKSLKSGLPFVVFVGVEPVKVNGAITVSVDDNNGNATPRVLVSSSPTSPALVLPANATSAQIAAVFARREDRPSPSFFDKSLRPGEVRLTADDDDSAAGRWPKSIPFPRDAVRYKSATMTQSIFKYTGDERGIIRPVSRRELKMESQVPGGMEGIRGWTSDLYKSVPVGFGKYWRALLPVRNSSGFIQHEWGFTRGYPDGTWFADLLSKDGKPFELRIREKSNGKWESYIAFRDKSARPDGYHGLAKTCSACHNQAGSGDYGVALWSGADTVISDPVPDLERGAEMYGAQ